MIRAKTPIVNSPKTIQSVKYYTVANKIVPIRRVTSDMIPLLQEPINSEVILNKVDIKRIIKEKKRNNPLNKFFKRALKYINKFDDFINKMKSLKLKTISQKRILLETDKVDQKIREYQAKRIVKENQKANEEQKNQEVNLKDIGGTLAAALGLGAVAVAGGPPENPEIIPEPPGSIVGKIEPETYPINSPWHEQRGYEIHPGVDIGTPDGTYIGIKAESQIITVGRLSDKGNTAGDPDGYGNFVAVWVPSLNKQFVFGHLSQINVNPGQKVPAGNVIARTGHTGRVTGPHLHFEAHASQSYEGSANNQDPTGWIKWLILGSKLKKGTSMEDIEKRLQEHNNELNLPLGPEKKADGGIDLNKKIMVGEAGTEFVIPISEMPLFMQAMMEEKLKSLNPFYTPQKTFGKIGIKSSFGQTNKKFADGAIVINYNNPNYGIAAKKLKELFPMAKNYHIAAAMGNFETEAPGLIPTTQQVGGPGYGIAQWTKSQRWSGAESPLYYSALKFGGPGIATSLTKQLEFVKFELTDPRASDNIAGGHQKPTPLQKWLSTKDVVSATETWMNVYEQPGTKHWEKRKAAAISFDKNMNSLLGITTKKDNISKPKEKGWWDNFIKMLTTSPDGKSIIKPQKKASLNDIDQSNQMAVAKDYQRQFEMSNDNVNEIIPLQIRVHYTETA